MYQLMLINVAGEFDSALCFPRLHPPSMKTFAIIVAILKSEDSVHLFNYCTIVALSIFAETFEQYGHLYPN